MERKIGEIFEYNSEWYQCIVGNGCKNCAFNERKCYTFTDNNDPIGDCCSERRTDKYSVGFKKLEKVGEPYKALNRLFQAYKVFTAITDVGNYDVAMIPHYKTIDIEIKQTKEDMEEKKPTYEELLHYYHSTVGLWAIDRSPQEVSLDWICDNAFQLGIDEKDSNSENIGKNLREFNLEVAKAGKPVCTRDGRKARIICFDKVDKRPIVALISDNGGEFVYEYLADGKSYNGKDDSYDLMMLSEKKEGWVNVYKERIYDTKEEAIEATYDGATYVDTVKVSWEE